MKLAALPLLVLATAACGSKAPAPVTNHRGGAPAAGPPYAALFEEGKTLTFKRVSASSRYEPDDPKANPDGTVVERSETQVQCTVAARVIAGWQVANVVCPGDDELLTAIAGVWAADARGVWHTEGRGLPTDEAQVVALVAGPPLLAAEPKPIDAKQEGEEGFGEMHKVSQAADGTWCVEHGTWGGDEGGWSYCFRAGLGLTKAGTYFAGGMTQDDWVELMP